MKISIKNRNFNKINNLETQRKELDITENKKNRKTKEVIKKIKVISLFSGSGGLDLGFLQTGKFEIIFANDFNKAACETYRNNIGNHIIYEDISKLKKIPNADVIIGGPPCQGFSLANPSRSFEDPRNQLFKEYARILTQVKPKLFLMENVSGMATMNKGKVFEIIKTELSNCGYKLCYKLLNSKDFGVPQSRNRMIIIGVRNDIENDFKFPIPTHTETNYKTVGDVLIKKAIPTKCPNHIFGQLTDLNLKRIQHIPEGGSMKDCPLELQNNSDLNRSMRRLSREKVSYTIVHNNCDHYYHPIENRRITIREMARIQGYPDDFVFSGSKSEQSRQVGNSVPVGLGNALGIAIHDFFESIIA